MALKHSPSIVSDGLVLYLDAANTRSYPKTGTTWFDISSKSNDITLLNSPTFTPLNNGGITFDGIDDYSAPTINHSYLNSSAIEVWFKSNSHGTGNKTIAGYRHNSGYSAPTIGSIYLNNNDLRASVITTTQTYRTASATNAISTGIFYQVVLNKDTSNGSLQLFKNGISVATQTFDISTYAQWPTSGNFIGANTLDIAKSTNSNSGQGWGSDYFNGNIYSIKLYSKILSAAEVLQNFNAMRGRFGI